LALGIEVAYGDVISLTKENDLFIVESDEGRLASRTVIVASGTAKEDGHSRRRSLSDAVSLIAPLATGLFSRTRMWPSSAKATKRWKNRSSWPRC
jgi:hypothetical protein